MYDYCGEGITSVSTAERSSIQFYPNPTSSFVNIQAPVGTIVTVFDARGREVETTTGRTVELPSPGQYVIVANYKAESETIVRQ